MTDLAKHGSPESVGRTEVIAQHSKKGVPMAFFQHVGERRVDCILTIALLAQSGSIAGRLTALRFAKSR